MRDTRARKVLRDLWQHKARTLLVVLAITVGLAGAGTVLDTWSLLTRVTTEGYRATNPASATLRVDSLDAALLARVRALPAIRNAEARRTTVGRVLVQGAWKTAVLFALDDFRSVQIGTLTAESGAWPPGDGDVVLERSSVDFAGLGIGEALTLRVGEGPERTLLVSGVARDVGLAPGWMEHVVYAFVTPATLARLGVPATLDQLQIVVRDRRLDREAVRRVAYSVKAVLEQQGHRVTRVEVPEPGRHIHAGQINSLLYIQGAFGALALFLSGFLVVNLIAAMLTGQIREIGVMKAIGAQRGQIAVMYLGVAFFLGILACLIAIPVAAWLGVRYARFIGGLLNFDPSGYGVPRGALLLQFGVGILLPAAAAAIPVLRGCGIPVSEALRDFGIARESGRPGILLTGIGGVSRPFLLSLRNAFRRRQRMALTLLTLALGGAVYLAALNLRASIRGSVRQVFGELLRYDVAVQLSRPAPVDSLAAAARAVSGVVDAEAWAAQRAAVRRPEGILGDAFPIGGIPADSRMVSTVTESGRWLRPGDGNVLVVSRRLLEDEPALAVGAGATLVIGGRAEPWIVVGVTGIGPGPIAFAPRDALARAGEDSRVAQVVAATASRNPVTQGEVSRRLREELVRSGFEVGSAQLMAESRRVLEDHLLLVAGFLLVMSQAMLVVGGLGLASTMSLAVLERTREIGVLRAIGARHRTLVGMLLLEGLVVGIASWAIAIPLSLPMSLLLGRAFGRIMMPVPVLTLIPEPSGLLWWLGVVVGVSLLASAWPAFRATRITTAAALAYE